MNIFMNSEESYRQGYLAGYAAAEDEKRSLCSLITELQAELFTRPTQAMLNTWKERDTQNNQAIFKLEQELLSARQELALVRQQQRQGQQALLRLQQRLEQTTKNAPE